VTSSIYPIDLTPASESVNSIIIDTPGNTFTGVQTVTIAAPSSGTQATGTAVIGVAGVIETISAIGGTNSGYSDGEAIAITGGSGSDTALATAVISGGVIQSLAFTDRGINYLNTDTGLVITGAVSGAAGATFDVTAIAANGVRSIIIDIAGSGYTAAPTVTIVGTVGSGATATAVLAVEPDSNILASDIAIISDMVSPGGGGILRLYFAFAFSGTPATIGVFNNDIFKGNLNADNDSQVVDNGYYRFDIDVEAGDNINLQCSTDAVTVNFVRAHLVQFGA